MRYSQMLIPTLKEAPAPPSAPTPSHELLVRAGYMRPGAAGLFSLLPLGMRALHRVARIVRQELNRAGAQEVLLPLVQPAALWQASDRLRHFGPELLRFTDRHGDEFVLGAGAEESVTALLRDEALSHERLPLSLYQLQGQFRDEERPRGGLLRGRESLRLDAWSFHADDPEARRGHEQLGAIFGRIFRRCGVEVRVVEATPGPGESHAHEFHALVEGGEDISVFCDHCDYAATQEVAVLMQATCARCGIGRYQRRTGVVVGHSRLVGTRYSARMGCDYTDQRGVASPLRMGGHSLVLGAVLAAAVEQHHDEQGIRWPLALAPFHATVISVGPEQAVPALAQRLYDELQIKGVDVLYDDRDVPPAAKERDADLIGVPLRLTVGGPTLSGQEVEIKSRDRSLDVHVPVADVATYVAQLVQRELEAPLAHER